jgi:hypothetical protein
MSKLELLKVPVIKPALPFLLGMSGAPCVGSAIRAYFNVLSLRSCSCFVDGSVLQNGVRR